VRVQFFGRILAVALLLLTIAPGPPKPGSYGIPPFTDGTGWIGRPVRPLDLSGKVVLVDFWEYTCINCLRTLPYLKAWYQRYHDDGLEIIGVHTPEFGFSGNVGNVREATQRLGIAWPVVVDADNAIWNRYGTDGWPEEFLFDRDGRLVHTVVGEGPYQETELMIQSLLKAGNPKLTLPPVMALLPQDDYTKPGARCYPRTPEVLLEHTKIADAPAGDVRRNAVYADPGGPYTDGAVYLAGTWRMDGEAAVAGAVPAALVLRYHATQLVGVLAPPKGGSVRVAVTEDGAPVPKADAGSDVHYDDGGASYVTVDAPRAYELIMNAKMGSHDLRLAPAAPGTAVYSFAFESCEVPN